MREAGASEARLSEKAAHQGGGSNRHPGDAPPVCRGLNRAGVRLAGALVLLLAAVLPAPAAVFHEDFSAPPESRGWSVHGDASAFTWNAAAGDLSATWDSTRPNTFFLRPLGTVLTRTEDLRFAVSLVVADIGTGSPQSTFPLAIGFLGRNEAFRTNSFRGAGVNPAWGPRNLVEFDYFPASQSITPTFSAVAVGTNNLRWAMANLFPFELTPGDRYRIALAYTAADRTLRLDVRRNGEPWCAGSTRLDDRFGDFHVDAFAVNSYSGDHQPAGYGGQILAHGVLDDLELEFPDPPAPRLEFTHDADTGTIRLATDALAGWVPHLERTTDWQVWEESTPDPGAGDRWEFTVSAKPGTAPTAYRLRLERP